MIGETISHYRIAQSSGGPLFSVNADGQRFVAITGRGSDAADTVYIILNWPSLLNSK